MSTIFLSYARGDEGEPFDPARSFVARLERDLRERGFDVWFDRSSMPSRSLTFHQEIRDAVSACDRLLLVVGPKAVASDYVGQEWRFAYFQADKIVTPILRRGEMSLIPDELKLLHCEDFRDDAHYAFHLEQLTRMLREPLPQLGKLIGVPSLPAHFLSRASRLAAIRDALRADLDRPVVIGGAAARIGLHGMGGIGKSVLASALAHDRRVREAFPDGIVWVGMGPLPNLADLQRRVHRDLGGDGAFQNEHEGQARLKELLADKAVLLVIDDVWRRSNVEAFNVLSPRCRAMITTRDAGLLSSLGGTHHVVELLTDAEALDLLAQCTGVAREEVPNAATEIIGECGRLPLAVSLAGGMIRAGTPLHDVLAALREHELEFVEDEHAAFEPHRNLWKTIEVSVEMLSAVEQQRFSELAVFPTDEAIPEPAVTTLWEHTGGLSPRQARQLLVKLKQRWLVQLAPSAESHTDGVGAVSLHDLIHDFCVGLARRALGDERALHARLLDAYQKKCTSGWASGPHDGYSFTHLRTHFAKAGRGNELVDLLHGLRWLEVKNQAGLVFDLGHDFAAAEEVLDAGDSRRRVLQLLDEALRRDIHFIHRHRQDYPQALFQSLWNNCWWYDSPESSHHYEAPEGSPPTHSQPSEPPEPRLSTLLVSWRKDKTERRAVPWLRSLRPPTVPLGGPQQRVLSGHDHRVTSVAFSPDGRQIASGSSDETIKLWDPESGQETLCLRGHTDSVWSVAFSPDGKRLASGSHDCTVKLWDVSDGRESLTLAGHAESVSSVAFSPDGNRLVSGSWDHTIKIWDVTICKTLFTLSGHSQGVTCAAFSRDGKWVASGSADQTIKIWDAATGREIRTLEGHLDRVTSISFSPDDKQVVSSSWDRTVRVWDVSRSTAIRTLTGHADRIDGVAFSPDGKQIASGSHDTMVKVWDAASGRTSLTLEGHRFSVTSVAFSPDGKRIASGSADKTVRVWDAVRGQRSLSLKGRSDYVLCVAMSSDGKRLASGSQDATVEVWDALSGRHRLTLRGHTGDVFAVALSPEGKWIASGGMDQQIRLWDAETGRNMLSLDGHTSLILSVAFSPDGRWLATGSADQTIKLWDVTSGCEVLTIPGHTESVSSVAYSADGTRIASGSYDQLIKIWDASTGDEIRTLAGHTDHVTRVAFSEDGKRIASEAWRENVRVWDVASGRCLEIIEGRGDVRALANGPPTFPWRALSDKSQTTIDDGAAERTVAWYPVPLGYLATAHGGRRWAGADGKQLHLVTLEGEPANHR